MTAWFLTYIGKIFKTKLIVSHQRPNVDLKDPLVIELPQIHFYFQQCFPHLRILKWLLTTTILHDDCRRIKSFFTLDRCHLLSFSHLQCFAEVEIVATSPEAGQDGRLVQRQVSHQSSCGTGWWSIWSFNATEVHKFRFSKATCFWEWRSHCSTADLSLKTQWITVSFKIHSRLGPFCFCYMWQIAFLVATW